MWKESGISSATAAFQNALLAGITRHHDTAESHCLDTLEIFHALLDGADGRLPKPDQAIGIVHDVGLEPPVVGVEACFLVVKVRMIADQHADCGIDDLGSHTILVLIIEPNLGIPAATVQIVELGAADTDILGGNAGCGDQAHRDWRFHALDNIDIAHPLLVDDTRRPSPPRRIDMVDVAVGRFGDMGIGRNRAPVHYLASCLHDES